MMVPPNPLPRFTLALFKEGYVLFVVVGSILALYVVGLVLLRKFDKKDVLKVCLCSFNHAIHNLSWMLQINFFL